MSPLGLLVVGPPRCAAADVESVLAPPPPHLPVPLALHRGALDALLESAADSHGPRAAGLRFAGHEDGVAGLQVLQASGARVAVVSALQTGGEGEEGEMEQLTLGSVGGWLARLAYVPRSKVLP
ncbi:hypothetical protein KGD87_30195 [Myxococcus sp. SDU36]|nr:hypothetical protein KGD87_30195 [Myxococcus sp. SDU36]